MTALTQFERLESGGVWRAAPDAPAKEVTVSFGKATLVLSDAKGRPLTHWSLPAITRQNSGTRPAVFTPDEDASETLEIEDDLMVDAIEKVRKALVRATPQPAKRRGFISLALVVALIAACAYWGPSVLQQQTLSAVPPSKRAEIGTSILGHYQRLTGTTCRAPRGTAALGLLKTRLMGPDVAGQIVVVQELPQGAAALPGGIVMLDRAIIERFDDPAVPAGFVLAALAGDAGRDPLRALLDHAGLRATMTLFTTGDLPGQTLQSFADKLHKSTTLTPQPTDLRAAFDAASVPGAPYVAASSPTPELSAIFADQALSPAKSILSDGDWVRLQGICAD